MKPFQIVLAAVCGLIAFAALISTFQAYYIDHDSGKAVGFNLVALVFCLIGRLIMRFPSESQQSKIDKLYGRSKNDKK